MSKKIIEAKMPIINGCVAYKPTIWNRLGFGTCDSRLEDNDFPDMAEAFISTNVLVHFDIIDRLRILLSGKVMVAIATKTSVICEKAISTSNTSVLPPTYIMRKP